MDLVVTEVPEVDLVVGEIPEVDLVVAEATPARIWHGGPSIILASPQ